MQAPPSTGCPACARHTPVAQQWATSKGGGIALRLPIVRAKRTLTEPRDSSSPPDRRHRALALLAQETPMSAPFITGGNFSVSRRLVGNVF
jgi:hypothetical protein